MRRIIEALREAEKHDNDSVLDEYIDKIFEEKRKELEAKYPQYDKSYHIKIAICEALMSHYGDTKHIRIGEYEDEPDTIVISVTCDYSS